MSGQKIHKLPQYKTVIVNGREHNVVAARLSYEDLVQLTMKQPVEDTSGFTVTYSHGKTGGSLTPGQDVLVHAGMVFNAMRTGSA